MATDQKDVMVLGFVFSPQHQYVLLIRKSRPAWQRGRYNGVGGKIKLGESPVDAMVRECEEETGLQIPASRWGHRITMLNAPGTVYIFVARESHGKLREVLGTRREPAGLFPTGGLPAACLSNLRWLIPLLADHVAGPIEVEYVEETQ